MKKIIKLVIAIIVALAIISGIMILVDCSSIKSEKEPIFAKMSATLNDGGTVIYTGFGYKIIDFHMLNGYDETKVGTLFTKPEDFSEEYKKYDVNLIPKDDDTNQNNGDNKTNSGDIENESGDKNQVSGDTIISSGDYEVKSGDTVTASGEKNNNIEQPTQSGDLEKSGDKEEVKPFFIGSVVGIKENTMLVRPMENQEIFKSSDMISFSIEKLENVVSQNYIIGQKVKVTYTGDVKETYPAGVDAISVEIVNN